MNKHLNCIMLVDDDADDNFFHELAIKENNEKNVVVIKDSAMAALEYLKAKKEPHSDLIFLDINMPAMNGWEFLAEYEKLDKELKSLAIIIMLTTSPNPSDVEKAKTNGSIADYIIKPLTNTKMREIANKYFGE